MLRSLLGAAIGRRAARSVGGGEGIVGAAVGMMAMRLATRSIPGALLVGGGALAAKMIGKRMRDQRARRDPGSVTIDQTPRR